MAGTARKLKLLGAQRAHDAPSRADVLALLREHGGYPRSYFATMPGLRHHAAAGCLVPYRELDGVAIALDAPVGPPGQHATALADFLRVQSRRGLIACCYKLPGELAPVARKLGFRGLKFGEEALLDLPVLSLSGRRWRDSREALRRLPAEGYGALWYDLAADPLHWREALREISQQWLKRKFGAEMGFAVGTLAQAEAYADEQRMLVLADQRGPAAFISLVPVFGPGRGWALDMIRQRDGLPRGAMDYLLTTAIRQLSAEGCDLLSLGLAPLASVTPGTEFAGGSRLSRARDLVYRRLNRLYNFRGLREFKSKYRPRWEPRYLVFPGLTALPQALLALYRAHFESAVS